MDPTGFAPLASDESFRFIVQRWERDAAGDTTGQLIILADARTAAGGSMPKLLAQAKTAFVFGHAPNEVPSSSRIHVLQPNTLEQSRFLILLSPALAAGAVWRLPPALAPGLTPGAWSTFRHGLCNLAKALLLHGGHTRRKVLPRRVATEVLESDHRRAMETISSHFTHMTIESRNKGLGKDDLTTVLKILKSLSAKGRLHDILFLFVEQIAQILDIDRCSIVRVWGADRQGHVLASSDDESIYDTVIELGRYPEIQQALASGEKIVIEDVPNHPLMRPCPAELANTGITALLIVPIVLNDPQVGSFLLRAALKGRKLTNRAIGFCEVVGEAAANALERTQLLESLQKANERLERLAITDGLTGLYNYRYFQQRLQQEFNRAVRYRIPLACIMMDVDDFKHINDTLGHLKGDAILKELSARIMRTVRSADIVARYGGEELVAIMPQTDASGAAQQASRLLKAVSDPPYDGVPDGNAVTVSIGVAVLNPDTMSRAEDLVQQADQALYTAKTGGKNRIIVQGTG